MQLDKTFIAVRERDYLDLLDLGLHVGREFFLPLAAAFVCGVLPVALLSHYLATTITAGGLDGDESSWRLAYSRWLLILAALWAPLAGAPATLLLGQAMFHERASVSRIVRDLAGSLPQLFLFQVVLRTLLGVMCLTAFIPFVYWPYMNEIVLLERNPLSGGSHGRINTMRRSTALHSGSYGDLFGRWLLTVVLALVLLAGLVASIWGMKQWLSGTAQLARPWFIVSLHLAVWTVVAYFTVVRFLSYLDLRIRREGWEVELKIRAEGVRLEHELV